MRSSALATLVGMQVIGHRGATSLHHPDNTLAAIDRARRHGADGVEVDVRLTADGVPVLHHDDHLADTRTLIRDVAFAALPRVRGHRIPTLAEALDLTRGVQLVVEVKTCDGVVGPVVEQLRRARHARLTVSSFDRQLLRQVHALEPRWETALLGRPAMPLSLLLKWAWADGHRQVHPHVSSLLPHLGQVPEARLMTAWTVDRPAHLRALSAAGLRAVICDEPGAAVQLLRPAYAAAG